MEQKISEKKIGRVVSVNITHDFMITIQEFEFLISRDPNFPEPKNNKKESKVSLVIRKLIGNYVNEHWDEFLKLKKQFQEWRAANYYSDGKKISFTKKKKRSKIKHERRSKKYEQEDINEDYEEDQDVTETPKKEEEEE